MMSVPGKLDTIHAEKNQRQERERHKTAADYSVVDRQLSAVQQQWNVCVNPEIAAAPNRRDAHSRNLEWNPEADHIHTDEKGTAVGATNS